MVCPVCGKIISDEARFCGNCGTRMEEWREAAHKESKKIERNIISSSDSSGEFQNGPIQTAVSSHSCKKENETTSSTGKMLGIIILCVAAVMAMLLALAALVA